MLIGVNEHMDWDFQRTDPELRNRLLSDAKEWGADFIRLDYAWASIQPSGPDQWDWNELDGYVGECANHDLQVLIMLYMAPGWATGNAGKPGVPNEPEQYGEVLGQIGKRYGDTLIGIEMWNEPDLDGFWAGSRDDFVNLLAEAYPVAKAISSETTFIAGAPTYIGLATDWYPLAYEDDRFRPGVSFDAVAIHPYMSPANLPPWAPDSDWSVRGITRLQEIRLAHGDDSPLWATEFGWSTHPNNGSEPNHALGVNEQQHAAYSVACFKMLEVLGIYAAAFYTDMDMAQTAEPHERNFGMFRTDGSAKPIVDAFVRYFDEATPPPPDNTDLETRVAAIEAVISDLIEPFQNVVSVLEAGER
jgi:hypothetical protein